MDYQLKHKIIEHNFPYCKDHPQEKLVRICINQNCSKYFEVACMECLDQHSHNIQEIIKLKDFFGNLEEQIHSNKSHPIIDQQNQVQLEQQKQKDEKSKQQNQQQQQSQSQELNDFEIVSFDSDDDTEEYLKQREDNHNNNIQKQNQNSSPKFEQINSLLNYIKVLEDKISETKQYLEILNESLIKESMMTPNAQVSQTLTNIFSNPFCTEESISDDITRKNLNKHLQSLKQLVIKDNKSLVIVNSDKQVLNNSINNFTYHYSNQLKNIDKELTKLNSFKFKKNTKGENCMQRFVFSQTLKGNQPALNFQDKGVWQKGNEDRFILMEPKLILNEVNRWALRINDSGSWSGVGIANKDIILAENFQFTKYTGSGRHGSYLVSNNGYSWNYRLENQNMQINTFTFSSDDLLLLEYNPILKKLIIISSMNKKVVALDLGEMEMDYDHYACINICSGASMKIIDDYIWPDIQTLKNYKFIGISPESMMSL